MQHQQAAKTSAPPQQQHTLPAGSPQHDASPPAHSLLQLQHAYGNTTLANLLNSHIIQAKLTINQPGDKYEQEADRVAEMVMRMPEPGAVNGISHIGQGVQRQCAACASGGKKCAKCHEEEEKIQRKPLAASITPLVQRSESSAATPEVTPQIAANINALGGSGQPLSESSRAFFESRFGVGFSEVRIHTSPQAKETARRTNARAFTFGPNIVFGSGQFDPGRMSGKKLLAHELTHVVQQQGTQFASSASTENLSMQTKHFPYYRLDFHDLNSGSQILQRDDIACPSLVDLSSIPIEKWSLNYEHALRANNDNRKAYAIHRCRCYGECGHLLTADEVHDLIANGKRYVDEAKSTLSPADQNALAAGSTANAAAYAVAIERLTVALSTTAGVSATSVLLAIPPAALIALFIVAFKNLWAFGTFVNELEDLGYVVLIGVGGSPLGECIYRCHTASQSRWRRDELIRELERVPLAPIRSPHEIDIDRMLAEWAAGQNQTPSPVPPPRPTPPLRPTPPPRPSPPVPTPAPRPVPPVPAPRPAPPVPAPRPRTDPDLLPHGPPVIPPSPTTAPRDPDAERRRRCPNLPIILYLPRAKAQDFDAYEKLIGQLEHVPNRPRDTNQLTSWRALTPGRIPPRVWERAQTLGLTRDQVVIPFWSQRAVYDRPMQVDHDIEMQVTPIGREGEFDTPVHHRLMDAHSNLGAGPELEANIKKMREALASCTGDQGWMRYRIRFEKVASATSNNPGIWTRDELIGGKHLDAYELLGRPKTP